MALTASWFSTLSNPNDIDTWVQDPAGNVVWYRSRDAGLMHLAHLRGLKAIGLGDTQVTDSGVTLLLTRFPDLEEVGLSGAANVSAGVIHSLLRMRKLKLLALPPQADTTDVRADFAKRRSACRLE